MKTEIITIERQIRSIHPEEILRGAAYGFTYVYDGRIGYGESARAAILDAGPNEVAGNLDYRWFSSDFYFVSQCYNETGDEAGLLFKF